jgi:peptidoglycan/LPS O-acetylase OafA/YrhL
MGRLAGLDTLRALAIVVVMIFHLQWTLPKMFEPVAKFGWMGVDLFFVLSGYLIGTQLLRPVARGERPSLKEFYRRRAFRILPAYLVVLGLYAVWPRWHEDTGMSPWWEFLTFTENLFVNYAKNHAFSHVWSLCVEEHFYLLLPLLVLWLSRGAKAWKTIAVIAGLMALGVAVRSYELVHVLRPIAADGDGFGVKYIETIYYPTYTRLDGLLAGVSLALLQVFRPRVWEAMMRRANVLVVAGVALVGASLWMFADRFTSVTGAAAAGTVMGFPVLSLGLAMLVAAAVDTRCWLGRCRIPGARVVAMLAFSLYLTHKEVASVVDSWWPRLVEAQSWVSLLVVTVSCLIVAVALYFGVERTFLKLRDRGRAVAVDVEARVEPAL